MNTIKEARNSTIILFLLISLGIIGLYLIAYQSGIIQTIQDVSRGLIHRTLILNVSLTLVTIAGVLLRYERMRLHDIGIVSGKLRFAILSGIAAWIIIQGTETVTGLITNGHAGLSPDWKQNSLSIFGLLIGHLLGTALWEEIAFRGFLLNQSFLKLSHWVKNKTYLAISAIFISQLVFMLFHIPYKLITGVSYPAIFGELAGILYTGVLYAALYYRTDNLFLVMIFHALGNAPTPLVTPIIGTNNLLSLFMILILAFWPKIMRLDKEYISRFKTKKLVGRSYQKTSI